MCCFATNPVGLLARLLTPPVRVSATNIFARMLAPGVQGLAYGMNLVARQDVAMILPLPVVPGSGDAAVAFIDLTAHARMFEELHQLFAAPQRKGGLFGARSAPLVVHQVGSFVASYVPTRADFTRLDPRFRLADAAWDALPGYADHGFAVFQLAPGKTTVHPMALSFPTRAPDRLFFPTVHVHDGRVHARARFDHALYYQGTDVPHDAYGWAPPRSAYAGLADPTTRVARWIVRGRRTNADLWLPLASPVAT
ncbi:MAG: hypothetical protein NT062_30220 [Proteobacteria bacterium]|nr:hypothetical protein [Pseudomonadota bacterium]